MPQNARPDPGEPTPPPPTCPRCRGRETFRLAEVWQAAGGAASGAGYAAPPAERSYGAGALTTVLGALLAWGVLGAGYPVAAGVLAAVPLAGLWMLGAALRYNHGARVRELAEWERRWRCAQCGMEFAR